MFETSHLDIKTGHLCGDLVINIVETIKQDRKEVSRPSSLRFHLVCSLGSALLILVALLFHPITIASSQDAMTAWLENLRDGLKFSETWQLTSGSHDR